MSTRGWDDDDICGDGIEDDKEFSFLNGETSPLDTSKKKVKKYGKKLQSTTSKNITEEQKDNGRFNSNKRKSGKAKNAVSKSRPPQKKPNPDDAMHSNMFYTIQNSNNANHAMKPNPKARRGKRDKQPQSYENLGYSPLSPERQTKSVCETIYSSDEEKDIQERRQSKVKRPSKTLPLNIKSVNKKKGTADSALDKADAAQKGGGEPKPYKKSGERGLGFATLNGNWLSKHHTESPPKSHAYKPSGSRKFSGSR
jgi:hypothetical protein